MTDDETNPVREATTDALVSRGADRRHLEALTGEQFRQFVELVVEMDAGGRPPTWSKGLGL